MDQDGYINLKVRKVGKDDRPITTFSNMQSAKSFMAKLNDEHQLCQKLTGVYKTNSSCFNYSIKECRGACVKEEEQDTYNIRVQNIIDHYSFKNQDMVIIDSGRDVDERCAILIENGIYRGFGFYNLNYQINNIDILQSIITPMQHNRDVQHIIQSFLRRNKRLKVIKLDSISNNR